MASLVLAQPLSTRLIKPSAVIRVDGFRMIEFPAFEIEIDGELNVDVDSADGDTVRIFNDDDSITATAKLYPSSRQGEVRMAHGWEYYQFPEEGNFNTVTAMMMKPTQLVRYPEDTGEHLHFFPNFWGPTGVNSDNRVQVEKAGESQ